MIIVMGLPGAGKTTVLTRAQKERPEYKIINYGTLMFDIAKEKYHLENRDQIRILTSEQQKRIQTAVDKRLSEEKGKVILDTHCSILNPGKKFYLPGLTYNILINTDIDMLVLITGDILDIVERRSKDKSRIRSIDPKEINEHDQVNRMMLATYSVLSGAPLKIITNRNGKVNVAVEELLNIMK